MKKVKNDLFDYKNRYIYQYEKGFKFSLDSILLAEYVKVSNKIKLIVDFGTGNAPIPLILSTKTKTNIIGVELQKQIYDIALESIKLNNLDNQITIINDNIINILNHINEETADIVVSNPPYFVKNGQNMINKDEAKMIARHDQECDLETIFVYGKKILKNKGCLYLSNRITRLDDIIVLGRKYNLGVKEIAFIDTKGDKNLKTILVKCVKGSKPGIKTNFIDISSLKSYQNIF